MIGETIKVMDRESGRLIDRMDSLRQRLTDCLSFPRGTLPLRRNYGADLLSILDRNMTPSYTMDVFVCVSDAVNEPDNGLTDFKLEQVGISSAGPNHVELMVIGVWIPNNQQVQMEGVRIGES
ncbi:MAG: hypothetical protein ACRDC7_14445 [Aeromonas veronii]